MPQIESRRSLLEMMYKQAKYIACTATGYEAKDIKYILIEDDGDVTVLFEWSHYSCGSHDTDTDSIYLIEADFSDITAGVQRIIQLREDAKKAQQLEAIREKARKEAAQLAEKVNQYNSLKEELGIQ